MHRKTPLPGRAPYKASCQGLTVPALRCPAGVWLRTHIHRRTLEQRWSSVVVWAGESEMGFPYGSVPYTILEHCPPSTRPQDLAPSSSQPAANLDQLSQDLTRLQAFEAYKREMAKPDQEISVLKCAALFAKASKYPSLQVDEVISQVDRLALQVEKQLPKDTRYPMHMLRVIINVLYSQKGFHGNTIDYYDDDNSYINMVLLNKAGIPISLGLLFIKVARRVGLPMKGVNLPAHFMLACDGLGVLVDAYAGEVVLTADAEAKLSALMQVEVKLDADRLLSGKGVPPRQFLMRMLNNLKQIYLTTGNADMALRIIKLMRVTQPSPVEIRDEGLCLFSMGRHTEAVEVLMSYLKVAPKADDARIVLEVVEACKTLIMENAAQRRIDLQFQDRKQQQKAKADKQQQTEPGEGGEGQTQRKQQSRWPDTQEQ